MKKKIKNRPQDPFALECQDCGRRDQRVRVLNDPYAEEINGVIERIQVCPECDRKRAAFI
jgi:hypothetical protein